MAFLASTDFTKKDIRISHIFKALSHPARVAILKVLAKKQTCICGDLVEDLPLAQSTISQHLKVLKEAGLIKGEIDGPRSCYCLDEKGIKEISRLSHDLFSALSTTIQSKDC